MIVYLDASVLVRFIVNQPGQLAEWDEISEGVTSRLGQVECFRAIDRLQKTNHLTPDEAAAAEDYATELVARLTLMPMTEDILNRAASSYSVSIGSLDAIHLATALVYRDTQPSDEPPIRFATHDNTLAAAARALKFDVIGT